jgi:uncharacterized membrane protein
MKSSEVQLPTWRSFVFELLVYSVLIVGYFYFALHYLGGWFKELYDHDRKLYATVALLIMIGQAVGLQIICSFLMWAVREATQKKRK